MQYEKILNSLDFGKNLKIFIYILTSRAYVIFWLIKNFFIYVYTHFSFYYSIYDCTCCFRYRDFLRKPPFEGYSILGWKKGRSGHPCDPRTIAVPIAFTTRCSWVSFERDGTRELNVPAVWLAAVQIIGLMGHRPCTIAVRRSFINVAVLTKKLITIVADNHRY